MPLLFLSPNTRQVDTRQEDMAPQKKREALAMLFTTPSSLTLSCVVRGIRITHNPIINIFEHTF